MTRDVI